MSSYPELVKEKLDTLIHDISQCAWLFAKDRKRDFTRSRKLSFEEMLRLLVGMGGGNLIKELLDHFAFKPETASSSAFIQQRAKILPDALELLFHEFTNTTFIAPERLGWEMYKSFAASVMELFSNRYHIL